MHTTNTNSLVPVNSIESYGLMWVEWNPICLRQASFLYFQNWMNEEVIFSIKINNSVFKKHRYNLLFFFQGPHTGVDNNLSTPFLKR